MTAKEKLDAIHARLDVMAKRLDALEAWATLKGMERRLTELEAWASLHPRQSVPDPLPREDFPTAYGGYGR